MKKGGSLPYKPFDAFAKEFFVAELACAGDVETTAVRAAPEQAIDVRFIRTRPGHPRFALLDELAGAGSLWEPFSTVPTHQDVRDNVEKHLGYNRSTRRKRREKPWEAPHFRLWVLSPFLHDPNHPLPRRGRLDQTLRSLSFTPDLARGDGFYTLGDGWNTGVIVLDALDPTDDETLWLRLLGRGSTLSLAIARLKHRIEAGSPDDLDTLNLLIRWGIYGRSQGLDDPWLKDILMQLSTEEAFQLAVQKLREEFRPGLEEEIRPAIIEQAKPAIIEQAKPAIIEQARPQLRAQPLLGALRKALGRSLSPDEEQRVIEHAANADDDLLVEWIVDVATRGGQRAMQELGL